jgi:hypothetical protein
MKIKKIMKKHLFIVMFNIFYCYLLFLKLIEINCSELTKPCEVGDIFALFLMKSPYSHQKVKF